jgi:hypothetical protein
VSDELAQTIRHRELLEDTALDAEEAVGCSLAMRPQPRANFRRVQVVGERVKVLRRPRHDVIDGMARDDVAATVNPEEWLRRKVLGE